MKYVRKDQLIAELRERLELLNAMKDRIQKELLQAPEGSLNVVKRGNRIQYYHYLPIEKRIQDGVSVRQGSVFAKQDFVFGKQDCDSEKQNSVSDKQNENVVIQETETMKYKGMYIRSEAQELAKALAQKDYDIHLLKELERESRAIMDCLQKISKDSSDGITDIYASLVPARKLLVTPLVLPDDEYIAKWKSVEYTGKPFLDNDPEHFTDLGERVRSKSEVMIANALTKAGIPYRYEYPINIRGFGTVYPDFYCLKIRTREEVAWEHMGLLDDEVYRRNALDKINKYEANGYVTGRNLIISHETADHPLNRKIIEMKIEHFLM